ncbi:Ger(x)C family spore germination protein [Brevibacillus sp. SYSU BS000544]|uniref:Ger(x)C family spore germination protein n=1 Tax=Brevibacillus sp. SYSU BS000544 TaxID=3416443 RepID=UPI003CE50CAA
MSRVRNTTIPLIIIFFFMAVVASGCAEKRVLERMGLIVAAGYDPLQKNRMLGTVVLYQIDPNAKEKVNVIANTAYTSKGFRSAMNVESSKKLVSGQLRVALYNESLARKGVINLVDTLSRDSDIGTGVYLTVSEGRAFDILSHRYPEVSNIGTYLFQTIKQNVTGERMISPTLHEFLHAYFSVGKDPVLPYVQRRGNEVLVNQIAYFKNDKMVGLGSLQEAFHLKLLRDRFRSGTIELSLRYHPMAKYAIRKKATKDDVYYIVIEQISSNCKIKLVDKKTPSFKVSIDLTARLQEISEQFDLSNPEALKEIQNEINKKMELMIVKFLKKTQQMQIDPAGFGKKYLASVRNPQLTKEKWRQMYSSAKFNITVDTTLVRVGVTK